MNATRCQPHECPRELLKQKDWDVDQLVQDSLAGMYENDLGILYSDEQGPVAYVLITADPLYPHVLVDAVVVDKHRRANGMFQSLIPSIYTFASGFAEIHGAPTIHWEAPHDKVLKNVFDGKIKPKQVSVTLELPVLEARHG